MRHATLLSTMATPTTTLHQNAGNVLQAIIDWAMASLQLLQHLV
jgi:hypothetical protein